MIQEEDTFLYLQAGSNSYIISSLILSEFETLKQSLAKSKLMIEIQKFEERINQHAKENNAEVSYCIILVDLKKFKLDWCGDFLFVGIEPRYDLYTQLGGVAEYIENISFNINGRLDLSAYEYECTWPLALENALEPYHIGMIHPGTLAKLKLEDGENHFHGSNSIWQAPIGDARIKKQLEKLGAHFNIDYGYEGYMSIFMFPFTMISSTFGYSYSLQNFFPSQTRVDRTNFMSRFLTCPARNAHSEKIIKPFLDSSSKVKTNLLVFIRATVIRDDKTLEGATAEKYKLIISTKE